MQKENHSNKFAKDAKTINENIKRNKELEREIEDYNESVNININLVSSLFPNGDKELKPKIVETIQNYINLIDKQGKMQIESCEYEESLHKIPLDIQINIKENEELKNQIQEKVKIIHDLEKELHRLRKNVIINEPLEKHYVLPPTSENLDLHNQLRLLDLQMITPNNIDELGINKKGIKMKSPDDDNKNKEKEKEKLAKSGTRKKKNENKFFLMKISSILDSTINYLDQHSKKIKEKTKTFVSSSRKGSIDKNEFSDDEIKKKDKSFSESSSETSSLSEYNKSESHSETESNENSDSGHEEEIELKINDSYDDIDPEDIKMYQKRLRAIEKSNLEYTQKIERTKKNCKQLFNEIHTINKIIRKNNKVFDPNAEDVSSSDSESEEEEEDEKKKNKKNDKGKTDKKDKKLDKKTDKKENKKDDKNEENKVAKKDAKSSTKKIKKVIKKKIVKKLKDNSKVEPIKHSNSVVEKDDFKGPKLNLKRIDNKIEDKIDENAVKPENKNEIEKMSEERESEIIAKLKKLKNPNVMKQSKIINEDNEVLTHNNNELNEDDKKVDLNNNHEIEDKKDEIIPNNEIEDDKIIAMNFKNELEDEDKKVEEKKEDSNTERKKNDNIPIKFEKKIQKEINSERKYNNLLRTFEFKNSLGHHQKIFKSKLSSIPYPKKDNK